MDHHRFLFGAAVLIAYFAVAVFDSCDDCPVAVGSGCQCENICEYIDCRNESSDVFPRFQATTADVNITSIAIKGYQFKDVPSYAFNLSSYNHSNVRIKQIYLGFMSTLEKLQAHAFSGITSLELLDISSVPNLHTIDSTSFFGLSLSILTLYENSLSKFPTDSLKQIRGLRELTFGGCQNNITLQKGTFIGMSTVLDYLRLDLNGISNISPTAFIGLPNLNSLDLRDNFITTLRSGTFAGLTSLSHLFLDNNPIRTVDPHAFNGTDLPKLSSLSLTVSNVTVMEPEAFDTLPELKHIVIQLPDDDFGQGNCVQSISINCTLFPKLQHLELFGAVCADILQPLSSCIKSLSISSMNPVAWSKPVCLHQLENLRNLQILTLYDLQFIISFDLMGLKGLDSLNELSHFYREQSTKICDVALASTPYLKSLSLLKTNYIPKPIEKMKKLVKLTFPRSTAAIICNCSSYWLYNFTTSHGIDTSTWRCEGEYWNWNVKEFLEEMHTSGACNGSQPDFQEWDWQNCSKLCSSTQTTTNTMIFTSSTTPMQKFTSTIVGTTSSSTQKTKLSNQTILYSVLGSLAFVFLLASGVGFFWYKRFRRIRRIKVDQLALQSHEEVTDRWEVPRSFLQIFEEKLGSGAFGVVVKGKRLSQPPGAIPSTVKVVRESAEMDAFVAVKMLPSHANSAAKDKFFQEIETMKSLGQHPNLVTIIACITMSEPVCLIVDYCSDGDLLKFLKARKPSSDNLEQKLLSLKNLLSFAWQVADGMSFLSSKGYTHRDLAARNVLIHNNNIAKVSDFGLCRLTNEDTASYVTRVGRLPLRWLAPECIQDYKFSIASDVWAFGILLFEIFSLGSTPYEGMHLSEIESFLAQGKRMGQLEGCPDDLYQMMLQCWEEVAGDRPRFPELRDQLMEMLDREAHENYDYLALIPDSSSVAEE